jgi:hypothetical protein
MTYSATAIAHQYCHRARRRKPAGKRSRQRSRREPCPGALHVHNRLAARARRVSSTAARSCQGVTERSNRTGGPCGSRHSAADEIEARRRLARIRRATRGVAAITARPAHTSRAPCSILRCGPLISTSDSNGARFKGTSFLRVLVTPDFFGASFAEAAEKCGENATATKHGFEFRQGARLDLS